MKTIFIVNPKAKNHHSFSSWEHFRRGIDIPHEVFVTEHPRDVKTILTRLVDQSPDDWILVIGVGGDGTMNSVISGVIGFDKVVIGYIPSGSGNDFARGYNWPNNKKRAYTLLKQQLIKEEMDVLDSGAFSVKNGANGHFVNNIGIGFDAEIAHKANLSTFKKCLNKWSLGQLIYPILLCKEAFTFKPFSLSVNVDEEEQVFSKVWFVTISNQPFFGGGMKIAPSACPMDGQLDMTVVHGLSRWKLLFVFLSVFIGKHTALKEVHTVRGRMISLHPNQSVPVHVDGDTVDALEKDQELKVRVLPLSWKMLNRSGWQKC
ncbi:diacylglycerol kinase family lipid kinase [Bacillus sp. BHET2]|uniref:diacylglycerol/lipid kinase family protein n=1 Tax=Bacillus sp. BHET2 TaxID=2583818 RepID=UPI00110DD93D|nr:diacylglycerol kinase family protein [Bacillus sp. BHET2]TMU85966.1 diacylglycerol kinase family lipid kinase [Bacillus sp. BHET2]